MATRRQQLAPPAVDNHWKGVVALPIPSSESLSRFVRAALHLLHVSEANATNGKHEADLTEESDGTDGTDGGVPVGSGLPHNELRDPQIWADIQQTLHHQLSHTTVIHTGACLSKEFTFNWVHGPAPTSMA